jgi:tRNA A-37 threonylcarbamoyl transferase component Bud32
LNPADLPTETLRATPASSDPFPRGNLFADRYEIIEEIGQGGMGRVFKVFDRKIHERIAIKLIKPAIASEPTTLERFHQELKTARQIVHKNICRMYDIGEFQGNHFITMEYVSGEDLRCLIKRIGHFTFGKAVFIARQVCEGLAEAHAMGIVHRDLKPQNIMIDKDGNAKIMDFGIARSIDSKGITESGMIIGTPEYMSPEQAEGITVDPRSDLYSLGIILYEMLTGRVPFDGGTPMSIAIKQKTAKPRPPREFNPQIPDTLNRLILKCLEKSPDKRFASAKDILAELQEMEKGFPTTDRIVPQPRSGTIRKITAGLSAKRALLPSVIILGVLAVVLVFWILRPAPKPTPGPAPAKETLVAEEKVQEAKPKVEEPGMAKKIPPEGTGNVETRPVREEKIPPRVDAEDARTAAIKAGLAGAQSALNAGRFQDAQAEAQKALGLDPRNATAANILTLAGQKISEATLRALIARYAQALNDNDLLIFYRESGTPELFETIKDDTQLLSRVYDSFQSSVSSQDIRFTGREKAEVRFGHSIIGISKTDGIRQVLFEGTYIWAMEKRGNEWKIVSVRSIPSTT